MARTKVVASVRNSVAGLIGMYQSEGLNRQFRRIELLQSLARNLEIHRRILEVIGIEELQQACLDYLGIFCQDNQ